MFTIQPKNTNWNRKLNLIEKLGKIIAQKNGIVFFYFEISKEENLYFKCDENIFKKHFNLEKNDDDLVFGADLLELELKKCMKYPY
jgi:hypothetical protein